MVPEKVAFELGKSFSGRSVRVEYELQEELYRLNGIVLSGDTNVNLWMVQNGWSFYLLTEGANPDEQQFLAAEAMAEQKLDYGMNSCRAVQINESERASNRTEC